MSIERCASCEITIDIDYVECYYEQDKPYCEGCATPCGYEITYDKVTGFWHWVADDYDGAPDSPTRNHAGQCLSRDECLMEIEDCEEDRNYVAPDHCPECKEPAEWVEETIDYSGTHCTNGKGGVHHTGIYVSKCCGAN